MSSVATISQEQFVEAMRAEVASGRPRARYSHFSQAPVRTEPAACTLILGAGFSYGVVPLVDELMRETIGDYYYPDQDQSGRVCQPVRRKDSARFWAELNEVAAGASLPGIGVDDAGLPEEAGAAYQHLFTGVGAQALLALSSRSRTPGFVERLAQSRLRARADGVAAPATAPDAGRRFVDGFLRYVLDPGGEHGYGSTGRNALNPAHVYLAALLEAQQLGVTGRSRAFCRTILTTNFDTLLQNALQMVNLLYRLTDRPESGLDAGEFESDEGPIHLVYAHGSILRHNPASTVDELNGLEGRNVDVLRGCLERRHVVTIGYSGWHDGVMAALRQCAPGQRLYWCDISAEPRAHVAALLPHHGQNAVYVTLGPSGADGLMQALYEALVPEEARRAPARRYREWCDFVWNRRTQS